MLLKDTPIDLEFQINMDIWLVSMSSACIFTLEQVYFG